ncbi:AfsR/SARP family transcriptional regulator [Streptomyces sp. NRRL F-5123]|uniref:AfsR/SARP family transcriptional regulator n=1 Tax=Streptomyces sp. NRRL F-5123 TaxID=1463856 RepID=UPI0005BD164C|nr:AfsR/SARP family transcriptional regulator [Streptomyces sp. NRRL F-5123]
MPTFGLLGPLLVHDGTQERAVGGHKVRILLAALLLAANRTVSKDALKEALWGARPPATADASLFNHLTRLRRQLAFLGEEPQRITAVPHGYRLHVAEGEFDVEVFQGHVDAARAAHLRQDWDAAAEQSAAALALWRGGPLADLPEFADAEPQLPVVRQLAEARLQALEWGFDAQLALGRRSELIGRLTALAAEHPLREAFHRQLMLALHGAHRQAEALEVYARLRATLAEELGVDPSAAVRAAYQEVLAADAPADVPPPVPAREPAEPPAPAFRPLHQLPADAGLFTGRDAEVARLTALLRPGAAPGGDAPGRAPRPVVVSGMGGVGKTALTVHVAHLLHADYPDGQLYADLRGFGPGGRRSPRDLLVRFLSDLGVREESLPGDMDDCAALFRTVLAHRRMLLVLDNARDAAQVLPLLPGSGGCAVVVTSRHTLTDLPAAVLLPLAPLTSADQEVLLAALCGSERVLEEPEAAAEILARCGGLPLALSVVGGRLASRPGWPLSLLARRLSSGTGRLPELTVGSLDVEATIGMSYVAMRDSDLPPERAVARAFRLLGVWPEHEVTPHSAAALLALPVRDTARLLDQLTDVHLLQSPAPERYGMHDLLGEYAAERLRAEEPAESRTRAELRLLTWYVAAVESASAISVGETQPPPPLPGPPTALPPPFADAHEALAWYVRELPAIQHAITRAGALGRSDIAWRLAVGLFGYGDTYWWTGIWDAALRSALDIAVAQGDTVGQAWLYRRIAVAHGMAYRNEECLENLGIALELFEQAGDITAQASILGNLSALHVQAGRAGPGLAYALRSQELYREVDVPGSESLVLGRIADALQLAGDYAGAVEHQRRRLGLLRALGRPTALATLLTNYGAALQHLGERAEAFAALDEALAIRRQLGDHGGEADCLATTARVHHHFGEWEAARECWQACLDLARFHLLPQREQECLAGLAALEDACAAGDLR